MLVYQRVTNALLQTSTGLLARDLQPRLEGFAVEAIVPMSSWHSSRMRLRMSTTGPQS